MRQRHQQQQQQQQQPVLSPSDRDKLKTKLNTTYADDILCIAQHFGNQRSATRARVTDIDTNGITIEWEYSDTGDNNRSSSEASAKRVEEMQFAVREFDGAGSVVQEVSDLATEASAALGRQQRPRLARDKEMLDQRTLVSFAFVRPGMVTMALVIAGLATLGYLAFVDTVEHPILQAIRAVVSRDACYYVLVAVAGIHFLEACAVCQLIKTFQPRQMDTRTQVKWTVGGAVFGLFCLHTFISKILRQFALAEAMPKPKQKRR
ncbi:hypothetical protein IWW50_003943 [Coemansia erecta]|nr:hypothetical protein GGF43_003653 [Coemansia sp. RSA 2618]KAJ2823071.1 hypothetical protein IWW50_003943 [Coemansia erecta]